MMIQGSSHRLPPSRRLTLMNEWIEAYVKPRQNCVIVWNVHGSDRVTCKINKNYDIQISRSDFCSDLHQISYVESQYYDVTIFCWTYNFSL